MSDYKYVYTVGVGLCRPIALEERIIGLEIKDKQTFDEYCNKHKNLSDVREHYKGFIDKLREELEKSPDL